MDNMMQKPMQQGAPAQQPAQSQPMPAQGGGGNPETQNMLGFHKEIQDLIALRVQNEVEQNGEFGSFIDQGVTPEAAMELVLIIPELKVVFEQMGLFDGMQGGGGDIKAMPQQPAQAPAAMPMNGASRGLIG